MTPLDELPTLLATLYAAPLQPEKWQVFFDHLSRVTKVSTGVLLAIGETGRPTLLAGGGFAFHPEVAREYNEHYAHVDPYRLAVRRNPRIAVIGCDELVSREELVRSEIYNGLLRKNEMDSMTLLSLTSGMEGDFLSLWRRAQDGPMDPASLGLLNALLPHAQTALKVREKLEAAAVRGHFAEMALEGMGIAAFLVSATGRVIHRNRLAAEIATKGDGLRMEGATLTARNAAENTRLSALMAGAAGADRKAGTVPGGALLVTRSENEQPLHIAVLPVPEHQRSELALPCALVFANDPAVTPKSRAAILQGLYQLTPTETRLADLLLQGEDVSEAAQRMRVSVETARSHLKRVLAKTGTHRQTELMRLMLSLPGCA